MTIIEEIRQLNLTPPSDTTHIRQEVEKLMKQKEAIDKKIRHLRKRIHDRVLHECDIEMWYEFFSGCSQEQIINGLKLNKLKYEATGECFYLHLAIAANRVLRERELIAIAA